MQPVFHTLHVCVCGLEFRNCQFVSCDIRYRAVVMAMIQHQCAT